MRAESSMFDTLASEAWDIFNSAASEEHVVTPAAPILFFGDSKSYLRSKLRIITVGLNPSKLEFPTHEPFLRFPEAERKDHADREGARYDRYIEALNRYFKVRPYSRWFNTLEPLLDGFGASYYGSQPNVALHTDLCSPIATDPTWSGLPQGEQTRLQARGIPLWHRLVDLLRPDVILISVAEKHLAKIRFEPISERTVVHSIDRRNRYDFEHQQFEISSGETSHVIFGRAAQTPFGLVSHTDKRGAGSAISELLART